VHPDQSGEVIDVHAGTVKHDRELTLYSLHQEAAAELHDAPVAASERSQQTLE
jgi:hypothetical protein